VVRERLLREPGVTIRGNATLSEIQIEEGRVTGVSITNADGSTETLEADLVVDCTGRGSKVRAMLVAHGYDEAPEFKINMGISYTSALMNAPQDALGADKNLVVLPNPPNKRGAFVSKVEDGKWLVSLHTRFEKDLPKSFEEMQAFAAGIEVPNVAEFLKKASIAGEIRSYRKPDATWRRFDRLERFPERLLALGDAVTSFNPVYGQGMSVAWMQACALDDLLQARAAGSGSLDGLPAEYFPKAKAISAEAWNSSTLVDIAYDEVTGDKPQNAEQTLVFVRALRTLLADDPALHADYVGIGQMVNSNTVMVTPDRMARVMAAAAKL
jgi:2-polyprenyl-6-methoxyphenol hydroxylase-like FAD-dependent oxidoreductase